MKKYFFFLIIILLSFIFIPRSEYVELNHLAIIRKIKIDCNDKITMDFVEVIPEKKDTGMHTQYHHYTYTEKNISSIFKKIEKEKKHFYYTHVKSIDITCSNKKEILSILKKYHINL